LLRSNVHSIREFFEYAKKVGASAMNFTRYVPDSLKEKQKMNNRIRGFSLKRAYETIIECSQKYSCSTNTNQPLWCLIDRRLGHPFSAGFLGLTISANGGIQVTSRVSESIGHISDDNGIVGAYLKHPLMNSLRRGEIDGCDKCAYFKRCRGDRNISYALNGHFFGPDVDCWHWLECVENEK